MSEKYREERKMLRDENISNEVIQRLNGSLLVEIMIRLDAILEELILINIKKQK